MKSDGVRVVCRFGYWDKVIAQLIGMSNEANRWTLKRRNPDTPTRQHAP